MKKTIFIASLLFSILYFVSYILQPASVLAAPSAAEVEAMRQLGKTAGAEGANLSGGNVDPRVVVARIIRVAMGILGTIFVILTLYAGFLWMTAGGEEDKISTAKKLLYQGVIGLAIIFTAYGITVFVLRVGLGVSSCSPAMDTWGGIDFSISRGCY